MISLCHKRWWWCLLLILKLLLLSKHHLLMFRDNACRLRMLLLLKDKSLSCLVTSDVKRIALKIWSRQDTIQTASSTMNIEEILTYIRVIIVVSVPQIILNSIHVYPLMPAWFHSYSDIHGVFSIWKIVPESYSIIIYVYLGKRLIKQHVCWIFYQRGPAIVRSPKV